jgi:nicotinamide mononucleotide adenylyltransferase
MLATPFYSPHFTAMRTSTLLLMLGFSSVLQGQEQKITPTEELRVTVNEWVETMRRIQQEENEWTRDQEVLTNYREGLEKEIADLKEKIADAKTRKEGADSESLKQTEERDRYASANDELAKLVRTLEEIMAAKLPLIPAPLRAEPKVSQSIEDLERDLKLTGDKLNEGVSKRLQNLINLTSEIEKFQQTVVLRQELRTDGEGREFNMEVIYFGLSTAYAVNEDGSLALVGKPNAKDGWKFVERKDLAVAIRDLIASTKGDRDPSFISLPISN